MTLLNKCSEIIRNFEIPIQDILQSCIDEIWTIRKYYLDDKQDQTTLAQLIKVDCDGLKCISGWQKNGTKWYDVYWKDGKKISLKKWWENGNKWYDEYWKDGKETGHWESWYDNGTKESNKYWKNGKEIGHWEGWNSNGIEMYHKYWENGKQIGHWEKWDRKNGIQASQWGGLYDRMKCYLES